MANLSILGLYKYDHAVFSEFVVPDGVELEAVENNILLQLAELELIYPSLETMQFAIGAWSKKQLPVWTKLYNTTTVEYNPIENYDRKEDWTDAGTSSGTNNGTSVNSVTGYNGDTYGDHDKNQVDAKNAGKFDSTHTGRVHGNIGVTTTQQMLESEREVSKFNMVDYITEEFKQRFCVMVY